jgi:hypothetical protein
MDADALIWDLRDGWGGAVPEYLDLFNVRAPTMQVFGRDRTLGLTLRPRRVILRMITYSVFRLAARGRRPVLATFKAGTS